MTCCDFILIDGRIARTQLLNKRTFIVWLKSMDFVGQNDATEVGNNLPRCKNILQAIVSNSFMQNFCFGLATVRKPSNLHKCSVFNSSHRLLWMLTSELTVHMLKCIVRGYVSCPLIHDSSIIQSFIPLGATKTHKLI